MHIPLLKPYCFQCPSGDFTEQSSDVRSTKGAEAILSGIVHIGVPVIERRARAGEDQKSLQVRLKQNIDVDPLTQITPVAHVTRHGIECWWRLIESTLHCKPVYERRHIINARHCGRDLLRQFVRAETTSLIEELRQIWSSLVAGRESAKQS